jgi:hypothetical protein
MNYFPCLFLYGDPPERLGSSKVAGITGVAHTCNVFVVPNILFKT